jgi:integrase
MTRVRMKYLKVYKDKSGRQRVYFRKPGAPVVALPADMESKAFRVAYDAAMDSAPRDNIGASRTKEGSFSAVIAAYYKTKAYKGLSDSARRSYRGILERFRAQHGDMSVRALKREHVVRMLDLMDDRPGAQETLRKRLNTLLNFAADRGWCDRNPLTGMRRKHQAGDGFRAWTEADIAAFEDRWPLGSRERLALALLLYTGQRRSDVVGMGRQHVKNGRIRVVQQKTGKELWIRLHSRLKAELDAVPRTQLTFLQTQYGQPFTANGFGNWFGGRADSAGLPEGSNSHGLRKAAARRLAEAGCTPHQIMAITGHANLSEVTLYTASVDQERLADEAMEKVEGTKVSSGDGSDSQKRRNV